VQDGHAEPPNSGRLTRPEIQSTQMPAHAVVCVPTATSGQHTRSKRQFNSKWIKSTFQFISIKKSLFHFVFLSSFFNLTALSLRFFFQVEIVCHPPANGAAIRKNPHMH
jgi:hypothetical protein